MKRDQTKIDLHQEIVDATCDVFSSMLDVDLTTGSALKDGNTQMQSNITSVLNLGGDIDGIVGVHCSGKAAKKITGAFLGMVFDELDSDVEDAIGEVTNMVAGNLKISFAKVGIDVQLSIPTTVVQDSYNLERLSNSVEIVVPFCMDDGDKFWVELQYTLKP